MKRRKTALLRAIAAFVMVIILGTMVGISLGMFVGRSLHALPSVTPIIEDETTMAQTAQAMKDAILGSVEPYIKGYTPTAKAMTEQARQESMRKTVEAFFRGPSSTPTP